MPLEHRSLLVEIDAAEQKRLPKGKRRNTSSHFAGLHRNPRFQRWNHSSVDNIYKNTYFSMVTGPPRPLLWMGSSRDDVRAFPREVRRDIGIALYTAQQGETDPAAKPLRGFGGGSVLEIVSDHRGGTWRAVYTVRFAEAIYVLHAFQKKSKRGVATPAQEIELIRRRLAQVQALRERRRIQ